MLLTILSILPIVFGFGVLIFVHELGHFLAAKWAGIRAEAFAVGMGPVACSYRRGIGVRLGSSAIEHDRRIRTWLAERGPGAPRTDRPVPIADVIRAEAALGLSETEYSLRWLPIGGFVKMLGQEDLHPTATSDHAKSYQRAPVWKRMIVVSAGVVMNLLLACLFFMIAFLAGVQVEAPIAGGSAPTSPAGRAVPVWADGGGAIEGVEAGIQPGDRIVTINGDPARSFNDIQVAAVMAKPGRAVELIVDRPGVDGQLRFEVTPVRDPELGLQLMGVLPARSTQLYDVPDVAERLELAGLAAAGVEPGMALVSVEGVAVDTYGAFARASRRSGGQPLETRWAWDADAPGDAATVVASVAVRPQLAYGEITDDAGEASFAPNLLGLSPLLRIDRVEPDGASAGRLQAGDVLLRVGDIDAPRFDQLRAAGQANRGGEVPVTVVRDGAVRTVTARASDEGLFGILPSWSLEAPWTMAGFETVQVPIAAGGSDAADDAGDTDDAANSDAANSDAANAAADADDDRRATDTAAGRAGTPAGRIVRVGGVDVASWSDVHRQLLATLGAADGAGPVSIALDVVVPSAMDAWLEADTVQTFTLEVTPDERATYLDLGWEPVLTSDAFDRRYALLSAEGNPITAIQMGFHETLNVVTLTYVTIDRLFRRSVPVDQLRGPVGIVDLGVQILPRGLMYLIFLLGMISVNLAVLNFLPLPIVDGGLFLYLVYEKITGRPPSVGFQNAATLVGLALIGTIFVVTFFNDVSRLISP